MSFSVADEFRWEERTRKSIRSRSMSSRTAMLLATWEGRMAAVLLSPSSVLVIASSIYARMIDVKNALAIVILYSVALAEYLEPTRILRTRSSMGK